MIISEEEWRKLDKERRKERERLNIKEYPKIKKVKNKDQDFFNSEE